MSGPGDPDCKACGGDGVLPVERTEAFGAQEVRHPPTFRRCQCVIFRDIISNVDRGMMGLSKAARVAKSPLAERMAEDFWITAPKAWFRSHLRHIAIRQPPTWYFKVASDADLITAWLASIALKGQDILDPDAAKVSITHLTLADLVEPPELLIVRLGVKAARNEATPEVLLETLNLRDHLGLPTWIWDQPGYKLEQGHICYSPQLADYLSDWPHDAVSGVAPSSKAKQIGKSKRVRKAPTGVPRATLSSQGSSKKGGTE